MSHFEENKFGGSLNAKRFKPVLLGMDFFEIESRAVLLLKSQNDFAFVELLSEIFELVIKLVSFQFEEVISVIENNNHHFIFDFLELDLSVIVKFCYFIEFVPEDVSVLDSIHIDVEIHLKDSPLNEISDAF